MTTKDRIVHMIKWYREYTRPFFFKHEPARIEQLDKEEKWFHEAINTLDDDIHICFLGQSGIGKSTLINALVAREETLLPAGGIGPLTAQALTVRYGDSASFRATYHSSDRLHQVRFALLMNHDPEHFKKIKKNHPDTTSNAASDVDAEDLPEIYESVPANDPDQQRRNDAFKNQALLMIAGDQFEQRDMTYLIDGISVALGKKSIFNTNFTEEDSDRIEQLHKAIKKGLVFECTEKDETKFKALLKDHASGFLAPLIKTLEIKWNSDILQNGLVLVDLPGVGIAGDVHAKITAEYIREKAKAIVLVVQRGMTEIEAQMLRNSGFLNRLLHSVDDPTADPVKLIIAVTHVDDTVNEYADRDDRPLCEIMYDICGKTEKQVKTQFMNQLETMWQDENELSAAKRDILDRIDESLQVIPVSATEYRKFYRKRNPMITDPVQSNIPRLGIVLKEVKERINKQRRDRVDKRANLFFSSIIKRLDLLEAEWKNEERSREETESLRQELNSYIIPKRLEHKNRQGAFRNYLKETLPKEIESLVKDACDEARKKIRRYLKNLEDAHWATLRAAVTRGGTFYGVKHIHLPHDFAIRFEEPVAEIWGKQLLTEIRKRTREYADDCIKLVEDVVIWSNAKGAKVRTPVLEAVSAHLKEESKKVNTVGREAIDELREKVQKDLIKKIEGPIRRKCEAFVRNNYHIGTGVKLRILGLFDELASDSVDAAKKPAIDLLTELFSEVEKEIIAAFKEIDNPFEIIEEKIISTHERMVATRDKKLKEEIFRDILSVRDISTKFGISPI
jgi:hypothetical protein